jgi:hypothetical protein
MKVILIEKDLYLIENQNFQMKQVVVPLTKYNKIKIIKYIKINEHTRSEIEMLFVESN